MIIGVAVKAGDLMVALPKPNRHADCTNIILSLGLVPDIQNQWGEIMHIRVSIVKMGSSIHDHKHFYMRLNVVNWNGLQINLELIALGEMEFSRLGVCSEDLW